MAATSFGRGWFSSSAPLISSSSTCPLARASSVSCSPITANPRALYQLVHLFNGSTGFLLLQLFEGCRQNILIGSMNIQFHHLHHGGHFARQLLPKERNHNRVPGKDDMTYMVFADDLSQVFYDLFGVLLVRVPSTTLVTGLRPPADLNPMNSLPFHLLRINDMAKPENEDTSCVRIREHRGIPRVLLIETGQMIRVRLVVGVDARPC